MLLSQSTCYISAICKGDEFRPQEIFRPVARFPPSIPGSRFSSYTFDKQVYDGYIKEMEPLKDEVRKQILSSMKKEKAERLYLIDTIERLGLSYHFEEEIENQLEQISDEKCCWSENNISDLSTVALEFRLFRQHGLNITSDCFHQFTENGKFKNPLRGDVKGLLNLYEAAHLRTHSDGVLEEGLAFSRNQLRKTQTTQRSCPFIEKQVERALKQPLHRGLPVVETHHFTSIYEEDLLKNESLLRLAKLDHNSSQLLYREELSTLLRWWKNFEPATSLPHVRDRMVESYFLALASFPEPQHATSRIYYSKYLATGLFSDDVIDAYSTEEERKIFTLATERWDASKIDRLPECMIISFKAFKKLCDDFDSYALQHGKPYAIYHQRETWNEYIRSSKIQVDWLTSNELPTFEEYMRNAVMTTGIKTIACAWHLPMKSATEAVYDWVFGNPRILSVLMYFDRLHNDVTSWQFDKERGIATSIDCYMKEYNVSDETAKMKFWEMIEDCWKDLNEEYSRKRIAPITGDILYRFINQARIFSVLYQEKDGFTYSREYMEPFVNQVLLTPFKI